MIRLRFRNRSSPFSSVLWKRSISFTSLDKSAYRRNSISEKSAEIYMKSFLDKKIDLTSKKKPSIEFSLSRGRAYKINKNLAATCFICTCKFGLEQYILPVTDVV